VTALVWVCLTAAGALGAIARFGVDRVITHRLGTRFPFGILAVNLSGALILGVIAGLTLDRAATLIVGTGLIGAYTTFSTWMRQTQGLLSDRRPVAAALNIGVSLLFGVSAAWLGIWLGTGFGGSP
jgi:fluoride exporter